MSLQNPPDEFSDTIPGMLRPRIPASPVLTIRAIQTRFKLFVYAGLLLCCGGCITVPSHQQRLQTADHLAGAHRWQRHDIAAAPFVLTTYLPHQSETDPIATDRTLTVYIEGDGLAWRTRSRPSEDPTPVDPVGLRLALQHPDRPVAYLARACQYTEPDNSINCDTRFWTSHRFAPQVITASDSAISALKERTSATSLRLVGYSGGGAVAALVAARRNDVVQLITIAGNLDHTIWTEHHHLSPLTGSLNPSEAWQALEDTPQVHLVGGRDEIIGNEILMAYLERFPPNRQPNVVRFSEYTHQCCWAEKWQEIYRQISTQDRRE